MQLLRRSLVLLLLFGLTPGATELLEDGLHLLRAGHDLHQVETEHGDHHDGTEHGCNGWFHICSCHHSLPFAATLHSGSVTAIRFGEQLTWPPVVESGPEGIRRSLERPPTA